MLSTQLTDRKERKKTDSENESRPASVYYALNVFIAVVRGAVYFQFRPVRVFIVPLPVL